MEDYTKFKLKGKEELNTVLADKDDLFVIACNKCFKKFESFNEPESDLFAAIAEEKGKTILASTQIDFLCNEVLTAKRFQELLPEKTKNVFVISCGLGIQTIAELTAIPVYAASDTIAVDGQHGLALTNTLCQACGQCYLNLTGGICPVVDCPKSLLNGQCGGAKNGKCEVDKEKDCAWELIYERMKKQGRLPELFNRPIEVRDYSKINFKLIKEYVKAVREKRSQGFYGGIHPVEDKALSAHLSLLPFPDPLNVALLMSQQAGAPAIPIVEIGQHVLMGQKIATAKGLISSGIHASLSGTVVAIEPRLHPFSQEESLAVVIQSDGLNTLDPAVKPAADLEKLAPEKIIEIIREKGIVGMGGAGFPTAVKLKAPKPIQVVILNGCECEPILTADHRVLLEYADEVIDGLKAVIKASKAEKGVIAIEDNKADAVLLFQEKTADLANIEILVTKTKYPQGAEKILVKRVMGVAIPSGGLPMDIGALVVNVSTAKAVYDALHLGMPLIERFISVSGEGINKPGNYRVKIGTSVKTIIDYCGGLKDDDVTVKIGGPMMGFDTNNHNVPIVKCSKGIIAIKTSVKEAVECIKCGRCVDVCPMKLYPLYFTKYALTEDWQGMKAENVMDCIECGCCDYICASKIPIVERIKIGKSAIREGR